MDNADSIHQAVRALKACSGQSSKPHSLTMAHMPEGSLYTDENQSIEWTPFDQPAIIEQGTKRLEFTYGHHHQRIRQLYRGENGETTKTFAGNCEFMSIDGQQYAYTYLSGPTGLFGIHVKNPDGTSGLFYIHTDHLSSLHTITDENGNLLQELSFDAWGNRRDPSTWTFFEENTETALFDRGFTGHEHLYGFQLINPDTLHCIALSGSATANFSLHCVCENQASADMNGRMGV